MNERNYFKHFRDRFSIGIYRFAWDGKHLRWQNGFIDGTHEPKWQTAGEENLPGDILRQAQDRVKDIEASRQYQRY